MAKFNEYTQKATPADNDTLMIYDATSKSNKLSPFSGIWNWIVGKLTNAVISNLQTSNQTMIGAINELNSNLPGIEFLTRTITVESGKQAYDLQINATEYMVISICSEDRMGWRYTVTRGVSETEATQNWAVCFIGNPTGTFTFKVAVLKIK
nr:MAG TPA: hypothetical protein [Caudoviricetes sp.]